MLFYGARLTWGSLGWTKSQLSHQFARGVGVLSSVIVCVLPNKTVKLGAECGGSSYSLEALGVWAKCACLRTSSHLPSQYSQSMKRTVCRVRSPHERILSAHEVLWGLSSILSSKEVAKCVKPEGGITKSTPCCGYWFSQTCIASSEARPGCVGMSLRMLYG